MSPRTHRFAGTRTTARTALVAATVAAAGALTAPPARAATPLAVFQLPAFAPSPQSIASPGLYAATVIATSTGPGKVRFTVSNGCSGSAMSALVRIGYTNVAGGPSGSVALSNCADAKVGDMAKTVTTGSGPILVTINVVGSPSSPAAGWPSTPGAGAFVAP
ncbi:MAG: hypothetical protein QM658_13700 [Gordonia sp. (in: high G+C Gram-positive bacteria)]